MWTEIVSKHTFHLQTLLFSSVPRQYRTILYGLYTWGADFYLPLNRNMMVTTWTKNMKEYCRCSHIFFSNKRRSVVIELRVTSPFPLSLVSSRELARKISNEKKTRNRSHESKKEKSLCRLWWLLYQSLVDQWETEFCVGLAANRFSWYSNL
jgi:hypothetical protein